MQEVNANLVEVSVCGVTSDVCRPLSTVRKVVDNEVLGIYLEAHVAALRKAAENMV